MPDQTLDSVPPPIPTVAPVAVPVAPPPPDPTKRLVTSDEMAALYKGFRDQVGRYPTDDQASSGLAQAVKQIQADAQGRCDFRVLGINLGKITQKILASFPEVQPTS